MKVLFLDFDGVLHATAGRAFVHVPALAAALIGHEIGIVITSSHRIHQPIAHMIDRLGELGPLVVGVTPVIGSGENRQREIESWAKEHGVEDFLVLDDDARLFDPIWPPLILCNSQNGIDVSLIDIVKAWLSVT